MFPRPGRQDSRGALRPATEELAMFKMPFLCSAALIASLAVGIAERAGAQENAIPNFMSFDFGWQLNSGLDFRQIEGKVAPVGRDPGARAQPGIERVSDAENP